MKNLLVMALLLATSNSYAASGWPDGAEQFVADGCFSEGMKGRSKDATADQIKTLTIACKCYAKLMAANVAFSDLEKAVKKGGTAGEEWDLSPAGQRLRLKIEASCGKSFDSIPD